MFTSEFLEHASGLAEGAGGIDHVVDDDHVRVVHAADQVHAVHLHKRNARKPSRRRQRDGWGLIETFNATCTLSSINEAKKKQPTPMTTTTAVCEKTWEICTKSPFHPKWWLSQPI